MVDARLRNPPTTSRPHLRDFETTEKALKFWGVYKLMVGILAAAESLLGILRSSNPPEMTVWAPVTIAASVLLAIDGLSQILPNVNRWIYVALAGSIPVLMAAASGIWPERLWVFTVVIGFLQWAFHRLERTSNRAEIGSLACCVALICSLANTTFMMFRAYWDEPQFWPLSQIFRFMLPIALPWTLIVILLLHTLSTARAANPDRGDDTRMATQAADD